MQLFSTQQQALRQMVEHALKVQARDFLFGYTVEDPGCRLQFYSEPPTPLMVSGRAFKGLLDTVYVVIVTGEDARLTEEAFAAVDADFAPLPFLTAPPTVHNAIHIHGDVNGGTVAQGVDVTVTASEAAGLLTALRDAASALPDADERAAVLEQADNLNDELDATAPKPSKLEAFLTLIPPTALKYAPLSAAAAALAKAVGLTAGP